MLSAMELARELRKLDKDDLLKVIGLETRRGPLDWVAPALGAFTAGLLVGAGLGLLLAPTSGTELRTRLRPGEAPEGGPDAQAAGAGGPEAAGGRRAG